MYESAEMAWAASLELKVPNVDLWFPNVDQAGGRNAVAGNPKYRPTACI